jgi:hypothetical protein
MSPERCPCILKAEPLDKVQLHSRRLVQKNSSVLKYIFFKKNMIFVGLRLRKQISIVQYKVKGYPFLNNSDAKNVKVFAISFCTVHIENSKISSRFYIYIKT